MTTRHALLHFRTVQALLDLSNPNKSVCLPLVKGKAAGKMELIYQLYPPRGVHRNSIPATYTFVLEDWVTEEIGLMVSMVDTGDGDDMIFGFIAHDCWDSFSQRAEMHIDAQHHFVVVKYNPVIREGFIYFYKEAYAVIEKANAGRIESCRKLKQENQVIPVPQEQKKSKKEKRAPAKAGATKILYAEDVENLRETIVASLERRGYVVHPVENGDQLIHYLEMAAASGVRYDLVITDNDMPKITGLQALKHIRNDERFKDLPVIVFSGSDIKRVVEDAGGVYLGKDCDLADFDALIAKMSKRAA